MNWYFAELPALCAATALLELDDAHVGQWLLARPFVTATALGALLGSIVRGAALGAILELLVVDDLPMGHRIPLNGTIAAGALVLLTMGAPDLEPAIAFPVAIAVGHLFRRVENAIRSMRADEARAVDDALSRGRRIPFGRILAKAVAIHYVIVAAFLYAAVGTLGPLLAWAWPFAPSFLRSGAAWAFLAAPWLGLATVLNLTRPR